jgi:peptide/nickel transport system substrate-binding protein
VILVIISILLGLLVACRPMLLSTQAANDSQLVLTSLSEPKTFNPALNQEFPNILLFCFRGLTAENGVTGEVEPFLAESWEFSDDQRRVVFTLREGLKWSDGMPLTADDVVFTFRDVIFNESIPTDDRDAFRIGVDQVLPEVRKVDSRRVEFIMPEPFAPLLRALAGPTGVNILPRHVLQDAVQTLDADGNPIFVSTWQTNADPTQIVINGPYQMESYATAERIVFRRNPYFWKRDRNGQSLPYIDRIVWQFLGSDDTQLLRFRSGELDAVGDSGPIRPEDFSLLKREEDRGNFTVYNGGPRSGTLFVVFNLNQAKDDQGRPFVNPVRSRWFNTLEFRRAIAHAINRDRLINNVYRGIGEPQNSPISVQSPYYRSPEEGLLTYDYDPDRARELLQAAGFTYNSVGQLLDSEGNRVEFTLNTNAGNEVREGLGSQIKDDLAQIGIQVNFRPIDFNTLIGKLSAGRDWESILIGFTGSIEPNEGANLWTSQGGLHMFNLGPLPGQPPITDWVVSDWEREIDRLFQQGARELDEARRKEIYGEFQQIVQEQVPVIHLVNALAMMAARDRLDGINYSGLPSWGLWNIEEIRIKE